MGRIVGDTKTCRVCNTLKQTPEFRVNTLTCKNCHKTYSKNAYETKKKDDHPKKVGRPRKPIVVTDNVDIKKKIGRPKKVVLKDDITLTETDA